MKSKDGSSRILRRYLFIFCTLVGHKLSVATERVPPEPAKTPPANQLQSGPSIKNYWICRLNKDVRSLRLEEGSDGSCRAVYTKKGLDQAIGSAKNPDSCLNYMENVRHNLEAAKWRCVQKSVKNLVLAPRPPAATEKRNQ